MQNVISSAADHGFKSIGANATLPQRNADFLVGVVRAIGEGCFGTLTITSTIVYPTSK